MKSRFYIPLLLLAGSLLAAGAPSEALQLLANAPLRFEPAPDRVDTGFVARGANFRFEFRGNQALLRAGHKSIRLRFDGAARQARMQGAEPLASKTNLYLGSDPAQWRTGIPNYGRLQVHELYHGIDLAYYGNGSQLEYDLTVKPGADPRQIRLRLDGDRARLDPNGDLMAELVQKHPVAFQTDASGTRTPVDSRYRKNADGTFGFALGHYDRTRDLVIDPVLILAHYLAGSYQDIAYGIGHDSKGLIYVAGATNSTDFDTAGTPLQATAGGAGDVFLAVLNPALSPGSQLIYATYLGGTGLETFGAIAVGPNGDVYLTGSTVSANFPLKNAAQSALGGSSGLADAFVVWFDPTQTLIYSTLLGGGGVDTGTAIAVDSKGKIWIAGNTQSTDFPNSGGFQGSLIGVQNMFVAGFDPSQSGAATRVYSIYIGGTRWDNAHGIALAPDGTLWLAGGTYSTDIWMVGHSYQPGSNGSGEGYLAHINPGLGAKALLYSTFLGGSDIGEITAIVLDPTGHVIVTGYTIASDFPVTSGAYQRHYGGNTDAFVSILDPSVTSSVRSEQLVYSTYFGGSDADAPFDLKRDSKGVLYLTGYTLSPNLVTTSNAAQRAWDYSLDAFALKFDPSQPGAAALDYSSYLGSDGLQVGYGVDFDTKGNIYLTGFSSGPIFSAFGGPAKTTGAGNVDAFVVGLSAAPPATSTK